MKRRVSSWATGRHMPVPYIDGLVWRCRDCGLRLTRYDGGRLRHHPRGKA